MQSKNEKTYDFKSKMIGGMGRPTSCVVGFETNEVFQKPKVLIL